LAVLVFVFDESDELIAGRSLGRLLCSHSSG